MRLSRHLIHEILLEMKTMTEKKEEAKKISRRRALKYGGAAVVVAAAVAGGAYYYITSPPPTATPTATATATLTATPTVTPTQAGTIKIGFVDGLTGPAYYGTAEELRGARIATTMENAAGGALGRQVELVIADDQSDPLVGVSAMQRLIQENNVVGFTGQYYSFVSLPEMDVVHKAHLPWVNTGGSSDTLRLKHYEEVFFIAAPTSLLVLPSQGILKALSQAGKVHSAAAIVATDEFDQNLWGPIKQTIDAAGINLVVDTVDINDQDFTSTLLKYKSSTPRPDILIPLVASKAVLLIVKQAKSLGLAPTVQTPYVVEAAQQIPVINEYWNVVGDAGLYWATPATFLPATHRKLLPLGDQFVQAYTKAYGIAPTDSDFDGFDSVYAFVEAVKLAGSTDPDKIISALETINIPGTRVNLTFPSQPENPWEYHNIPRQYCVSQFQQLNQVWDDTPIVWPPELATGQLIAPTS